MYESVYSDDDATIDTKPTLSDDSDLFKHFEPTLLQPSTSTPKTLATPRRLFADTTLDDTRKRESRLLIESLIKNEYDVTPGGSLRHLKTKVHYPRYNYKQIIDWFISPKSRRPPVGSKAVLSLLQKRKVHPDVIPGSNARKHYQARLDAKKKPTSHSSSWASRF